MKLFFILIFFLLFILLDYYQFSNIENFDLSSGSAHVNSHIILFFFLIGALVSVLKDFVSGKKLSLKKSTGFFIIFIAYIVINIILNTNETALFSVLTFSSTGGLLFFYLLGWCCSNLIITNINYASRIKFNAMAYLFCYLCFIVLHVYFLERCYFKFIENIRDDLFLLSTREQGYQRIGDIITINFYIFSLVNFVSLSIIKNKIKHISYLTLRNLLFLVMIFCAFKMILIGQLIGSNKSFLMIIVTLFMVCIGLISNDKTLLNNESSHKKNFRKVFYSIYVKPSFKMFCLTLMVLFSIVCFDLIELRFLENMRFYGYGEGLGGNSLNSRFNLLNNFWIHFEQSPFFGDYYVENYTTGKGTFVHSFTLSLVTHTGLFGIFFFILYVIYLLKEKLSYFNLKNSNQDIFFKKKVLLLNLTMIFVTFALANLSVFFTWGVFWFILGLLNHK